jgi:hypothetical protein
VTLEAEFVLTFCDYWIRCNGLAAAFHAVKAVAARSDEEDSQGFEPGAARRRVLSAIHSQCHEFGFRSVAIEVRGFKQYFEIRQGVAR